ncbi:helix-turn-helix domain-containing protein [[Kitasatospora] papulosa]|uniref:helix-turn-helix domain-containing protein n=1 Tax=[Kitasatospora] papulosa TaxID=1464011 RepID=UPI00367CAE3D
MPGHRTSSEVPEPQVAFAADLRELRRRTFRKPTEEALARRMECGRSTVSAVLNGRRFPNWEHTAAFVEACGDDPSRWRERWLRASRQIEEASKGLRSPLPQLPLIGGGPESQGGCSAGRALVPGQPGVLRGCHRSCLPGAFGDPGDVHAPLSAHAVHDAGVRGVLPDHFGLGQRRQ